MVKMKKVSCPEHEEIFKILMFHGKNKGKIKLIIEFILGFILIVLSLYIAFFIIGVDNNVIERESLLGIFLIFFFTFFKRMYFLSLMGKNLRYRTFIGKVRDMSFICVGRSRKIYDLCERIGIMRVFSIIFLPGIVMLLDVICSGTLSKGWSLSSKWLLNFKILVAGMVPSYFLCLFRSIKFLSRIESCLIKFGICDFSRYLVSDVIFSKRIFVLYFFEVFVLFFVLFYSPQVGILLFVLYFYVLGLIVFRYVLDLNRFLEKEENYQFLMGRLEKMESEIVTSS